MGLDVYTTSTSPMELDLQTLKIFFFRGGGQVSRQDFSV